MNEPRSTIHFLVPVESEPAPPMKFPLLDTDSVALLARLERQLSSGKIPLSTKAVALATIKAQGLTRLHGLTFQAYCDQRLRLKRSRVHQLIEFAQLLEVSTKSGTLPSADNERQLRPLKRLAREVWADTWAEAVRTAPAGKISGRHVQSVVDARLAQMQAAQVPALAPASEQPPTKVVTLMPIPRALDAGTSAPCIAPQPTAGAHEFIRTVPAPDVAMPGWKPEWARMIRNTSRPPGAFSSSVFGWQAPD